MDKDILDMFNLLIDKMDGMEKSFDDRLDSMEKSFDHRLDEKLTKLVDGKMEAMIDRKLDEKLTEMVDVKMEEMIDRKLEKKFAESERHMMAYIENSVGNRLDALADGYNSQNYEQNDITETRVDRLNDKVSLLEDRVTVLEHAV